MIFVIFEDTVGVVLDYIMFLSSLLTYMMGQNIRNTNAYDAVQCTNADLNKKHN